MGEKRYLMTCDTHSVLGHCKRNGTRVMHTGAHPRLDSCDGWEPIELPAHVPSAGEEGSGDA